MKCVCLLLIPFSIFLACESSSQSDAYSAVAPFSESAEAFDARMAWWRAARFGMFIHWGPSAIPAGVYDGAEIPGPGEWIMHNARIHLADYEGFSRHFNPVRFDADEWVNLARQAGMKYLVITAKHYDGFCLWDSEYTEYDVVDFAKVGRDLLGELKEACDRHNMQWGIAYSIMDWHHPDAQAPHYPTYNHPDKRNPYFEQYFEQYLKPQVRELITKYNPDILCFDGEWIPEFTHAQGQELFRMVRELKPDILVNNQLAKAPKQDSDLAQQEVYDRGDFATLEPGRLSTKSTLDWEWCISINDTRGFKSSDQNWKSASSLIQRLIDASSKGGNFQVAIGPTPDGIIPQPSVDRLKEMGNWMRRHASVIYGSQTWEHQSEGPQIRFVGSEHSDTVYLFCPKWPGPDFRVRSIKPAPGSSISLSGHSDPLTWSWHPIMGLHISLPSSPHALPYRSAKSIYLFKVLGQAQQVSQAPRIGTESERGLQEDIFFSEKKVVIRHSDSEASIYYSLDGSPPDLQSTLYQGPFVVETNRLVRAFAVEAGKVASPEQSAWFRKSRFQALKVPSPMKPYHRGGKFALLDGQFGSENGTDGHWLGYEGVDVDALIDLGEVRPIRRIQVAFLVDSRLQATLPASLQFSISENGTDYQELIRYQPKAFAPHEASHVQRFDHRMQAIRGRYVQVFARNPGRVPTGFAGAGANSWLLLDEIDIP